ncbi:MAG TPA: HD domain-containing protein [Clostridiales bacterium]|nr:HD domain-containing protein [Clostridiales bacterium]
MDKERLEKQIKFIIEADRLKNIQRQTLLIDKSRRETVPEHSWHIALMAMVLKEYAGEDVDIDRVIKMLLVHDLVEIYAGDTFAYDEVGNAGKKEREQIAADRLFGMVDKDQAEEFRSLWEEFDKMQTPDALFAASLDRLQPFLNNCMTEGHTWGLGNVTSGMVYNRLEVIKKGIPELWEFVENLIKDCVQKQYLKP